MTNTVASGLTLWSHGQEIPQRPVAELRKRLIVDVEASTATARYICLNCLQPVVLVV